MSKQEHWGQLAKSRRNERGLSAYDIEGLIGFFATSIYQLDKRVRPITRITQASPNLRRYAELLDLDLMATIERNTLAFRCRVYRRLHNLTITAMAKHAGVTKTDLQRAEDHDRPLSRDHHIAKRLDYFFKTGEHHPQHPRHEDAPQTRAECPPMQPDGSRPCPWVGCRHHLFLELLRPGGHGSKKIFINPNMSEEELQLEPRPCSLDIAEQGPWIKTSHHNNNPEHMTLDGLSSLLGVSRERVRQIERDALIKLRKRAPWLLQTWLSGHHGPSSDPIPSPWPRAVLGAP